MVVRCTTGALTCWEESSSSLTSIVCPSVFQYVRGKQSNKRLGRHGRCPGLTTVDQALSSFSGMLKNLDPARAEDVEAYHSWMEEHAPVDRSETRFLEQTTDLLAVSRRRSAGSVGGAGLHRSIAIGLPLIAVVPLIALAVVPGVFGRLFVIVLIGSAEVAVVVSTELIDFLTLREWVVCASM
jgi:hypothetical protein